VGDVGRPGAPGCPGAAGHAGGEQGVVPERHATVALAAARPTPAARPLPVRAHAGGPGAQQPQPPEEQRPR